ncbi:hypothetical protein ACFXDO_19000 [Streptomyces nigra]|uniref:hypothetical protein n=1 Tax=Streptomyces nigra TaxID=1827580 RepID=UPI003676D5C0
MDDRSKDIRKKGQESRAARWLRRLRGWRLHQQLARGMAYSVGSSAVSLLLLWVQSRY